MKEVIMKVPSFSADYPKAPIYVADLVRCKECKHRHTINCFRAYLEYDIQEWVVDSGDDDDFCSYGERKPDD